MNYNKLQAGYKDGILSIHQPMRDGDGWEIRYDGEEWRVYEWRLLMESPMHEGTRRNFEEALKLAESFT